MITPVPVFLEGDWPPAPAGSSQMPRSVALGTPSLSLTALGLYGYLVSLGYSQDGLSPLPDDVPRRGESLREIRGAFCELVAARLVVLAPDDQDSSRIAAVVLPAPGGAV